MALVPNVITPYPDELLCSWVHRLAKRNATTMPYFRQFYMGYKEKQSYKILMDVREGFDVLCKKLGAEDRMKDIYLATSTFRLESIVMQPGQQTRYINSVFRKRDRLNTAGSSLFDTVKICPECVQEDKGTYGEAYIHRAHNLSGVCVCYKHGCRLLEGKAPNDYEYSFDINDFQGMTSDTPDKDEQAYAEYAKRLLDLGINMDVNQVKKAIISAMKEQGYDSGDDYEAMINDIESWDHHALFDGMDVRHIIKEKFTRRVYFQLWEVLPFFMFLYPDPENLINTMNKPEPVLEQYVCPDCGRIYCATPQSQEDGWGCAYCQEKIPEEERFRNLVETIGEGRYVPVSKFKTIGLPVQLKHKDCGEIFDVLPRAFLFEGRRCECEHVITESAARQKIEAIPGFHLVEFNGAEKPVTIRHDKCGHEFTCNYHKFLNFPGCRYCNPPHMTAEIYEERVKALVGDEYTIVKGFVDQHTKVVIRHNKCGCEQAYKPSAFLDGQRCRHCQEQMTGKDLDALLQGYSDGKYKIEKYDLNVCTVIDMKNDKKIKVPPLKIRQEIVRPTPSDILPIEHSAQNFEPLTAWDRNYTLLCEYKQEFGDADVVKRAEYKGTKLGLWCLRQRKARKEGKLSPDKIGRLDEIGFVWEPKLGAKPKK